jgi:hypothetical protein
MSRFEKFILVNEYTLPYDGTHINHTTSIAHIKKVYGNKYKVDADGTNAWAVFAKKGDEWIPVTTPFAEKATAEKFKEWLNSAQKDQKDMLGTISDKKPYIYPKATKANEAFDDNFAGWIAIYNGKKVEISKKEAKGIYPAKLLAIKKLKVPKSKEGLLAIGPAVDFVEKM